MDSDAAPVADEHHDRQPAAGRGVQHGRERRRRDRARPVRSRQPQRLDAAQPEAAQQAEEFMGVLQRVPAGMEACQADPLVLGRRGGFPGGSASKAVLWSSVFRAATSRSNAARSLFSVR